MKPEPLPLLFLYLFAFILFHIFLSGLQSTNPERTVPNELHLGEKRFLFSYFIRKNTSDTHYIYSKAEKKWFV